MSLSPHLSLFLQPLTAKWGKWSLEGVRAFCEIREARDPPAPHTGKMVFSKWPWSSFQGPPFLSFPHPQSHFTVWSLSGITVCLPCVWLGQQIIYALTDPSGETLSGRRGGYYPPWIPPGTQFREGMLTGYRRQRIPLRPGHESACWQSRTHITP